MKLKQLFIPLTGLALISLASPSYAGDNQGFGWDYKTLPGAACQPHIGAQTARKASIMVQKFSIFL
jgi:hypothetical protein